MAQWKQIILEGNRASITKREWCRQNGISEKAFFYWQHKIRSIAAASMDEASSVQLPAPHVQSNPQSFVEIPVPGPYSTPVNSEAASPGVSPELMIQVNDCRVFVNGTVQENTLRAVMKVIRNA